MAIIDDTQPPQKQGPSLVMQGVMLLAVSVAAIGIGWASGYMLNAQIPPPPSAQEEGEVGPVQVNLPETHQAAGIVYLDPITTNLAGPIEMWVRLEYALVFEGLPDEAIARDIHQDALSWLRSVRAQQIEGSSGFMHLKSDLRDRAVLRSEGRVKDILIRTLLFE